MSYRIATDSASDMPWDWYSSHDVLMIALIYTLEEEEYFDDGTGLPVEEFYHRMRKGAMPTTALINTQRYLDFFRPMLEAGEDIVYISFASALSASYQCSLSAVEQLREEFPNRKITSIDSISASIGQSLLVEQALEQRDSGLDYEQLVAWAEQQKHHMIHLFTVDDLFHLKRGGRVSGASAVVGTMLSVKPLLHMDDEGKLQPTDKVRGRKKAMRALVDSMEAKIVDAQSQTIGIVHGDAMEDAIAFRDMIQERIPVREVL